MKSAIVLTLFLAAVPAVFAQSEPCPLKVTDVRNVEASLEVLFTNSSSSPVSSFEFGMSFRDIEGQTLSLPFPLLRTQTVKPGQSRLAIFPTLESLQFLFPEASAYLLKVSFADGSSWADDGSRACGITSLQE